MGLDGDNVARFTAALERHLAGGGLAIVATHIDIGVAAAVLDLGGRGRGAT